MFYLNYRVCCNFQICRFAHPATVSQYVCGVHNKMGTNLSLLATIQLCQSDDGRWVQAHFPWATLISDVGACRSPWADSQTCLHTPLYIVLFSLVNNLHYFTYYIHQFAFFNPLCIVYAAS